MKFDSREDGGMIHMIQPNHVREIRESQMMSKAELARKADVTVQTIIRIEKGHLCRLDTKRKIILALGYKLGERAKIFSGEEKKPESKKQKTRGTLKRV